MLSDLAEDRTNRETRLKLVIVWLGILLLGSFWLTVKGNSDLVSMAVVPQVPREGESIIAIFKLHNPSAEPRVIEYKFYINGKLLKEGITTIAPGFSGTYKYAYRHPVKLGETLNFLVRTQSESGSYEQALSSPPYPVQIWSSFVSFASFSTTVMGFMSTMTYYQSSFGDDVGFNVGVLYSIILVILLIFLELSQPVLRERSIPLLGSLRLRFSTVTWILLIIFMGIVYTRVVMIIAS